MTNAEKIIYLKDYASRREDEIHFEDTFRAEFQARIDSVASGNAGKRFLFDNDTTRDSFEFSHLMKLYSIGSIRAFSIGSEIIKHYGVDHKKPSSRRVESNKNGEMKISVYSIPGEERVQFVAEEINVMTGRGNKKVTEWFASPRIPLFQSNLIQFRKK